MPENIFFTKENLWMPENVFFSKYYQYKIEIVSESVSWEGIHGRKVEKVSLSEKCLKISVKNIKKLPYHCRAIIMNERSSLSFGFITYWYVTVMVVCVTQNRWSWTLTNYSKFRIATNMTRQNVFSKLKYSVCLTLVPQLKRASPPTLGQEKRGNHDAPSFLQSEITLLEWIGAGHFFDW